MDELDLGRGYSDCASWLEISQSAFYNNISVFRKVISSQVLLGGVIKGNAYGHGFKECLPLIHEKLDLFFVISPIDAFQLREIERSHKFEMKRVIVLGSISAKEAILCSEQNIEIVISDPSWEGYMLVLREHFLKSKNKFNKLKCHIHIETGLSREGFEIEELDKSLEFIKNNSDLFHIQGVMSHFANTEDVTEQGYAYEQMSKLDLAHSIVCQTLSVRHKVEKHIAQSASTLILPNSQYDIVRLGISLYGFWPSRETKLSSKIVLPVLPSLKPAMSWKCKSQSIKKIKLGTYIGYGCSYRAERDLRIALFPIGYFDGYPRLLSNKGHVLVNSLRCKILGRVMMNHIVVDVTEATSDTTKEVVATLLGADGSENVTAENIAEWAQTIHYEIVARIGSHLKRVVVS